MDVALLRARIAVGDVSSVADLRPSRTSPPNVVLVTSPSCAKCAEFETEYRLEAEERAKREFGSFLVFRCSSPRSVEAALDAGVESTPRIAIVHPSSRVEVRDAFNFARGK